jgi:hypothetical protein
MNLIGVLSLASLLASVGGRPLVIAVVVTAPPTVVDAGVPSAKEQALMEHACRAVQGGAAYEAYDRCLEARLLSLRADFGPDLTRLSPSARASIDAACSPAQVSRGRDGYLECLTAQLASRAPRARATVSAKGAAAAPAIAPMAVDSPSSDSQEWSLLTVGAAAIAAASAIGALVFFRARRARIGQSVARIG